jgi:ferredoxin
MPYVITNMCLREGSCAPVCPVDCIVKGKPASEWPQYYIDRDTCIDCGACVPECPYGAIFTEEEVPQAYVAQGGERLSVPANTPGFPETYEGVDINGDPIHLEATRVLEEGEIVDFTPSIQVNIDFYESGPGYHALD